MVAFVTLVVLTVVLDVVFEGVVSTNDVVTVGFVPTVS